MPLVEEGWTGGKIAEMIAREYLREMKRKDIDTLVLGCTHYPLLKGILAAVMGDDVSLIDSAIETAGEIEKILGRPFTPEQIRWRYYQGVLCDGFAGKIHNCRRKIFGRTYSTY